MAAPSLSLEVFLYFGKLWDVVFWVLTFLLFVYKGVKLPYPPGAYQLEFAYLFLYLLVEPARLFLGSKGNKTRTAGPLYASVALGVFVLLLHVYYVVGQTFILRADFVVNIIAIGFVGMQMLLSLGQVAGLSRSR
uniref:Transmembrane protein 216 n=1 Tax=Mantoniella antarctica TaxID=81844 RepID=A0A7S0T2H8_9CHLO|mmetsp:Transcript_9212/g.22666  ORF Transcript_9212/g.22666 Transcript_9212/m.22666 type:complete len:135 (+) Transcript_9212:259-663(+)|eukprot:CAMPEP_0181371204 /NCGR_PEP_ID=MMETSP1106-20121128/13923_1 /TAXON_ID=81844 /ORGANISM="Mantoniella antarctica, Strain SL-175" /LENGTH=134 /DNA_ID=CAMNT_0023488225 /DNA_START=213 /DNA_END=617 /DNA_ORIENTATION=+